MRINSGFEVIRRENRFLISEFIFEAVGWPFETERGKMQNANVKDSTITIDPCLDVIVSRAAC